MTTDSAPDTGIPVVTAFIVGLPLLAVAALFLPREVQRFRRASVSARQDFDVWFPLLTAAGAALFGCLLTFSGLVALFR
jgi:membrane protein DedA with SNARE-associated domain